MGISLAQVGRAVAVEGFVGIESVAEERTAGPSRTVGLRHRRKR